jgi:hypothetical protein
VCRQHPVHGLATTQQGQGNREKHCHRGNSSECQVGGKINIITEREHKRVLEPPIPLNGWAGQSFMMRASLSFSLRYHLNRVSGLELCKWGQTTNARQARLSVSTRGQAMELALQHDQVRFEEQASLAARARFSQWRELELKQRPARILRFSGAIAVAIAVVLLISFR